MNKTKILTEFRTLVYKDGSKLSTPMLDPMYIGDLSKEERLTKIRKSADKIEKRDNVTDYIFYE